MLRSIRQISQSMDQEHYRNRNFAPPNVLHAMICKIVILLWFDEEDIVWFPLP